MTPREIRGISSATSGYSSSSTTCLTTTSTTTTLPPSVACRDRSSSFIQVDLRQGSLFDTTTATAEGSSLGDPMPNHNSDGSSCGKRSATTLATSSLPAIQTKNLKKRRRIGVVCRTHSPTASPHNTPKAFKAVKRIPPTLPGVQKAAQVLNDNGIVVFPTERTYEACVCWSPGLWEHQVSPFFTVAFRSNAPSSLSSSTTTTTSSSYHVYVPKQKLAQLDKLLGFPKRAYALKPPSSLLTTTSLLGAPPAPSLSPSSSATFPSTPTTTCHKIYYFSETRWILHRLAQRYWPGPVKIYVPARTSSSSSSSTTSSSSPSSSSLPCELLQPLPCCTTTTNQGLSHNCTNTMHAVSTAAATAITTTSTDLCNNDVKPASENTTSPSAGHATTAETNEINSATTQERLQYLGLRCPSHPLTARILQETSTTRPDGTSTNPPQLVPITPLWLGLPVQGSSPSSFLTTAQEVAHHVLVRTASLNQHGSSTSPSPPHANNHDSVPSAATVHVVNGEDKRELFAVPTCQHSSSISLWIDDTTRTIHVFGKDSTSALPFSVQQIERLLQDEDQEGFAFLRGGSCSTDSPILGPRPIKSPGGDVPNLDMDGRQRVIRAVLRKWKVVYHQQAQES